MVQKHLMSSSRLKANMKIIKTNNPLLKKEKQMTKKIFIYLFVMIFLSGPFMAADNIHQAAREGDLKRIIQLLDKNPALLNQQDGNGKTALHHACRHKKDDVAIYLIKKGSDINIKDENKATPLHITTALGNLELVKILLKRGAKSIKEGAAWNNTPLHLACERGHPQVVKFLLDQGADIEARNDFKRTPIICTARESGSLEIIKILVSRGANINATDVSNDTALTLSAWRGFKELVNYLIDQKSIIPRGKLKSALWMAAENNLGRLYDYVLQNGLNIKEQKDEYRMLIHAAAAGGSVEIVSSLIKSGFDPNLSDEDGWVPLHYAASQGKTDMINYLLQKGVDKNSRSLKGETAYHLAVFREFPAAAELLKKLAVDAAEPKFPQLVGPYMGQKPPGKKPEMFLPGIVSGHYDAHCSIVFSPDGKEACWPEMYPPREKGYGTGGVMVMKMIDNKWTYPRKSTILEGECFFSPGGKRLYFISTQPLNKADKGGKENIWYMEKTASGWSDAKPVDDTVNSKSLHWAFSVDKWDNLFFAGSNVIYRAENKDGKFQNPVDVAKLYNNNTLKGFCPFISPEGDYLIFSAAEQEGGRNIDLYVSFKRKDGTWTGRINLGEEINATLHDIGAFVTSDGKYLFFLSVGRDRPWGIYWVDASFIDELKQQNLK